MGVFIKYTVPGYQRWAYKKGGCITYAHCLDLGDLTEPSVEMETTHRIRIHWSCLVCYSAPPAIRL